MCCLSAVAASSASSCSGRCDVTTVACATGGAHGPLGRRSGFRYGRCCCYSCYRRCPCLSLVGLWICWRVGGTRDVPVEALFPEGLGCLRLASSGWSGSWGLTPLAARHTAISRTGRCSGDFPVVPRLARRHPGRRDLGPGRRGRRPVGTALPGTVPRPAGHGALVECRGARAADLGW